VAHTRRAQTIRRLVNPFVYLVSMDRSLVLSSDIQSLSRYAVQMTTRPSTPLVLNFLTPAALPSYTRIVLIVF
jgi:hypothetical protein